MCAAAPPGGGRSELTPRFVRHFSVLCLPPPLSLDVPKPRVVWNNLGAPGRLGQATKPSTPAPSTVLNLNNGLGSPITATLQGIIQDDDSDSPRGLSTTNAIVLDVL